MTLRFKNKTLLLKDLQDLTKLMRNNSTLFQGTKSKYRDNILYCVSRGIPDINVRVLHIIYIFIRETGQFRSKGIINDFIGNLKREFHGDSLNKPHNKLCTGY